MDEEVRDPSGYVLVFAEHPIIGRVFWVYINESDVHAPDYYGLSMQQELAAWVPSDWRTDITLCGCRRFSDLDAWEAHNFLEIVLDEHRLGSEYHIAVDDEGHITEYLSGLLEDLLLQTGQTTQEFLNWVREAEWIDEPAVLRKF